MKTDEEMKHLLPVELRDRVDSEKRRALVQKIRSRYFANGFDEKGLIDVS